MIPLLLVIILQYNTCKCKLTTNGTDIFFKTDTLQMFLPKGTANMWLSCANGWWVELEIENDGKERRRQIIPIDTRNQKPCKVKETQVGVIPRRLL